MRRWGAAAVCVVLVAACSSGGGGSDRSGRNGADADGADQPERSGSTAPSTTSAAACRGMDSVAPGATRVSLDVGGVARTARQFVPADYQPDSPVALVVNLHGYLSNGEQQAVISGMEPVADEEGFVVLFPDGTGNPAHWNIVVNPADTDDLAYLRELVADARARLCIDPDRVYLAGMSNGAGMTSTAACRLWDTFAAFAPVAGVHGTDFCEEGAGRPVPLIAFHGTADPFLQYEGGVGPGVAILPIPEGAVAEGFANYPLPPREEAVAGWASYDGCDPEPTTETVSASVRRIAYSGCREDTEVVLYAIEGGGHTWPGSDGLAAAEALVGPSTHEVDANRVMWDFFEAHPRQS